MSCRENPAGRRSAQKNTSDMIIVLRSRYIERIVENLIKLSIRTGSDLLYWNVFYPLVGNN